LPKAPAGVASHTRKAAIAIVIVAVAIAVLLVMGQRRFAASFFEFGNAREFEGVISEYPVPTLIVRKDAQAGAPLAFSSYSLVAEGKHGAERIVEGFDGRQVKLRGALIHRDNVAMIEVVPDSIKITRGGFNAMTRPVENLGEHTLTGEIVDSKCYLGVMNPGHTKPHRECASLCIRGGVPPLFVVRDTEGKTAILWLVSDRGLPINRQVLDFVAEPLEITGQVSRNGDQLFLRADPKSFRRMP
ncbi:MAG: hypothetical protein L0Y75_01380, partial [Acidobacteria bacterium]|nr:hypothetical protein [Acidobacteriota bacterium]